MTTVLFGQSYYLRFDPKLQAAMMPYPPLGTMYAASVVREAGYSVELFDAMLAQSTAEWDAALRTHQPRFAVIFEDNFNYLSKMCLSNMREAAFEMLAQAKAQQAITIVCGSDATDHWQHYLDQGADYVLLGEGEATLVQLLAALTETPETDLTQISGLAYQTPAPQRTAGRPPIKDVDALPFPAWDLIDVERYREIWLQRHGYFSMNMVTTRGCPYHCNWCAKPIWGQRYNARSPENVAAELAWLKTTYAPDHIWFADDIMGLKPNWFKRFAAAVEAKNAQLPFKCLSRADLIVRDAANTEALARAGCDIVWIGAESGAQHVLNAMEKGTSVEQIYAAAEQLHTHDVNVAFFLQFGYPGETFADIEKTLQMVRDCRPDDIGISVSYPLPGTKFHESVKAELRDKQNWTDSADLDMLYHGPFSTAFYRHLHTVVHTEYRARKAWWQWQAVWHSPQQWTLQHISNLAKSLVRFAQLPRLRRRLRNLAAQGSGNISLPAPMTYADAATPSPQTE